ncbi:MAG TPA: hypothetical protein VN676_17150 [Steroidobacteraceae bacterium]|nr:hypothetical protein [Steroidobacteraceae bacterium]
MRACVSWLVAGAAALGLCGCGGGGGGDEAPPQFVSQILSDPAYDGDIELTTTGAYVVTQGMSPSVQSVLAGIDPTTGSEFRTFLDIPLTGQGGVPGDALIDSAFLEFFVDDVEPPSGQLPVRVELIAFQPPTLLGTDFDRNAQPPLASVLVQGDVTRTDIGNFVSVDVTGLMIRAQDLGLVDFQVRIMEDLGPAIATLMVIDDTTGPDRRSRAPLLTVTYE